MKKRIIYAISLGVLSLIGTIHWQWFHTSSTSQVNSSYASYAPNLSESLEPLQPIPQEIELDTGKVALGKRLFHDPKLSRDNSIACAHCHDLSRGGDDQRPRAVGIDGAMGEVNTPTVFNRSLNFAQFWDGRAETLEAQIDGPIHHPKEMGSN
jgi:cytochrome c peroxidase